MGSMSATAASAGRVLEPTFRTVSVKCTSARAGSRCIAFSMARSQPGVGEDVGPGTIAWGVGVRASVGVAVRGGENPGVGVDRSPAVVVGVTSAPEVFGRPSVGLSTPSGVSAGVGCSGVLADEAPGSDDPVLEGVVLTDGVRDGSVVGEMGVGVGEGALVCLGVGV